MGNILQTLPQIPQAQQEEEAKHASDENPESFTCEICIEPTLTSKKFKNANLCSHAFCTDCMISYIRVKLEENDVVGQIVCPALDCDHALEPIACAPIVGDALFVRWCDVMCQSAILGVDKCYCPYRNCNVLILNECGGKLKKSRCPECKRWFCFQCKRAWHAGFLCGESGELRDVNDVAFGRLAEQRNWMRCPRCRHFVELREGCQIVKCRCGISFCYKCGKQVHKHWCSCSKASTCCEWCFRIFIILFFLTFTLVFYGLTSSAIHKRRKH